MSGGRLAGSRISRQSARVPARDGRAGGGIRAAGRTTDAGTFELRPPDAGADQVGRLCGALVRLSQQLERRFSEFEKLIELTEKVNTGLLLEEVLRHVFESFRAIIPYERIGLALLEDGGQTVRAIWTRSVLSNVLLQPGYTATMKGSSLQRVVETGRPRIINDLEAYLRRHPDSESSRLIVEEGFRSSLTCPLVAMGKPVGFLFFSSTESNRYVAVHAELFTRIAGQLSQIVERSRVYEELLETQNKLMKANRRLNRLATIDGLTSVPNRRAFAQRFEMEWRRAKREGVPLSLILVDVDDFKLHNDLLGHVRGDDSLRKVARVLRRGLRRAHDFAARYGGEEFVVILAGADATAASAVAERLRAQVEALGIPNPGSAGGARLTVSAGVAAIVPGRGDAPEVLLEAADRALYCAKRSGRNRVEVGPLRRRQRPAKA